MAETKTPRERLREEMKYWDNSPGGPADEATLRVWHAAQAVLAEPEPAPLTATSEFLEALDALKRQCQDNLDLWMVRDQLIDRLLRAPRPALASETEVPHILVQKKYLQQLRDQLADARRECEQLKEQRHELANSMHEMSIKASRRIAELEAEHEELRQSLTTAHRRATKLEARTLADVVRDIYREISRHTPNNVTLKALANERRRLLDAEEE